MPTALITGITGQDGSYLSEFLLSKGYTVHGLIRRTSSFSTGRLSQLSVDPHEPGEPRIVLHYGDLTDGTGLRRVVEAVQPDELYNLAAQSHVRVSFDQPEYTADVVATGFLRLLEIVRDQETRTGRRIRVYQAGSSEMFGSAPPPQNENTPFRPRSPYAAAKAAAHWYGVNYRESYGLFVCNGIMFNHESPRRGETFVTRKITRALGRIKVGLSDQLFLGNLDARRDWGFAGDYVEAMWLMLQRPEPADFVVATGEAHSVREFLESAAEHAGVDWRKHVTLDQRCLRPTEVHHLCGDAASARRELGWSPRVAFGDLVRMMVDHDCNWAERERMLLAVGHNGSLMAARERR